MSGAPVAFDSGSQTNPIDFSFVTATVSGRITDALTGDPVADAGVMLDGPLTLSTLSNSNGAYLLSHVFGGSTALRLSVGKSGVYETVERELTLPPNLADVNVALPTADIVVAPRSVAGDAFEGELCRHSLTISNAHVADLRWDLWVETAPGSLVTNVMTNWLGQVRGQVEFPDGVTRAGDVAFDGRVLWASEWGSPSIPSTLHGLDPVSGSVMAMLSLSNICLSSTSYSIAADHGRLWVVDILESARNIHTVDTRTGARVKTFELPPGTFSDITFGNGSIWLFETVSRTIVELDSVTGVVKREVGLTSEITEAIDGMTFLNGALWFCPRWTQILCKVDPVDGSLTRTVPIAGGHITGLSTDGNGSIWRTDLYGPKAILVDTGERMWLGHACRSGTLGRQESQVFDVKLDTRWARVGTNTCILHFGANDPDAPDTEIPVDFVVHSAADGDGDGMPDAWERIHFAGTGQPMGGPLDDWDGDRMPNREEYLAGTIPTNRKSLLRFERMSMLSDNRCVLTWQSVVGKQYGLWAGSNIIAGLTHRMTSNLLADPPLNTYTTPVMSAGCRFYRLILE